ncbi:hypothetical protein NPIL_504511 [Nephila pilipes]|uniref:Uncharacterized protein n=1 Tax=Nephila pilipes TaxID=299642 RepID=A0A8X6U5G1_NEPPI|nr:hypothetical protein NPIL_504511 [Nephila pilipes]
MSSNPVRECPEQIQKRIENEHLLRSILVSSELVHCLRAKTLLDIWTAIYKKDEVMFIILDTAITPVIKASVIINKELDLLVHIGQR